MSPGSLDHEADIVLKSGTMPTNGDHGDDVLERLTILLEVGQLHSDLLVLLDATADRPERVPVDVAPRRRLGHASPRLLHKAAIPPNHLRLRVARQFRACRVHVYDRIVGLLNIADEYRARHVHRAQVDLR